MFQPTVRPTLDRAPTPMNICATPMSPVSALLAKNSAAPYRWCGTRTAESVSTQTSITAAARGAARTPPLWNVLVRTWSHATPSPTHSATSPGTSSTRRSQQPPWSMVKLISMAEIPNWRFPASGTFSTANQSRIWQLILTSALLEGFTVNRGWSSRETATTTQPLASSSTATVTRQRLRHLSIIQTPRLFTR